MSGLKNSMTCVPLVIVVMLLGTPAEAGFWDEVKKNVESLKDTAVDVVGIKKEEKTEKNRTEPKQPVSSENAPRYDPAWVREFQQRLTALGYKPGPVDGDFGGTTRDAIKAFERSRRMAVTGLPTPGVMGVLREQSQSAVTRRPPTVSTTFVQDSDGLSGDASPVKSQTSAQESSGGLVAQPPGGGLIVPAPGGGQISSVASDSRAQARAAPQPSTPALPANPYEPLDDYMLSLLALRYIPGALSDNLIERLTELQVRRDQLVHEGKKTVYSEMREYGRYGQSYSYTPVFRPEQVVGRDTAMVTEELNPEFKAFLGDYLKKRTRPLPGRYRLKLRPSGAVSTTLYYDRGAGHLTTRGFDKKTYPIIDLSVRWGLPSLPQSLKEYALIRVSPLAWTSSGSLSDGIPPGLGEGALYAINITSTKGIRLPELKYLALDRDVTFKGVKMSAERAEQIITLGAPLNESGSKNGLHLELEFTLNSIDALPSGEGVLVGKLEGVKLIRSFVVSVEEKDMKLSALTGREMKKTRREYKRIVLNDFKPEVFPVRKATLSAAREEKAALEKEAANKQQAKLDSLAILGVRPGMPVKEAESLVRSEIKVETVYSFSPPSRPSQIPPPPGYAQGFDPYRRGLILVGKGGNEAIVLYHEKEGAVTGVSRRMSLKRLDKKDFYNALLKKYGKPTREKKGREWVWGDTGARSVCAGHGNVSSSSGMELLEGQPIENITYKVTGIGIRKEARKASALSGCKNVLQVDWGEKLAEFRLFNHSTYAPDLKAIEDGQAAETNSAADDLKL